MSDTFSSIPWNTAALWQAANAGLGVSLDRNRAALDDARGHAQRLRHLLERTFPIMEELCRQTCPACTDVCCQRAWVWADFKDLLFFHLAGIDPPDHQLLDPARASTAAMPAPTAAGWNGSGAPSCAPGTCARHRHSAFDRHPRK